MAITVEVAKAEPMLTELQTTSSKSRTPKMTRRKRATTLKMTRRRMNCSFTISIALDMRAIPACTTMESLMPTGAATIMVPVEAPRRTPRARRRTRRKARRRRRRRRKQKKRRRKKKVTRQKKRLKNEGTN